MYQTFFFYQCCPNRDGGMKCVCCVGGEQGHRENDSNNKVNSVIAKNGQRSISIPFTFSTPSNGEEIFPKKK